MSIGDVRPTQVRVGSRATPAVCRLVTCHSSPSGLQGFRCPTRKQSAGVQAARLLESLGPRMAIAAGLAADWGSEVRTLIGTFDKERHDPAKTWDEIHQFQSRGRCPAAYWPHVA